MKEITILAKAKINLTLEIFGKRPDGYHDMRTIMHKIGLSDTVKIELTEGNEPENQGKIELICSRDVCDEKDNLAYRAAEAFFNLYYKKTGKIFACKITIEKNIPEKSGLAGGGADCAAVLDGLQKLLGVINNEEKELLAASLGSDVPFMLGKHECALATGTGTNITDLPMMPVCYCLVARPPIGFSTKEIYDLFDAKRHPVPSVNINSLISGLEQEDFCRICDNMANQFEPVCTGLLPQIGEIKRAMLKFGAYCSQMTGSGSAIFGIFSSQDLAHTAMEALCEEFPDIFTTVCKI